MLPAAASLKKQGANKGATTAFLISTPESGVDSIAITYALLDPIMTVIRPVAAFFTAITAGLIENITGWEKKDRSESDLPVIPMAGVSDYEVAKEKDPVAVSPARKLSLGVHYAVKDVWGDIVVWFFAGLVVAAIITALIPQEWMEQYLGGGIGSMLIMLVVGVPIYICASASTPVAAALILKGVSPGAALVFLLVGPATNVTSLSVLIGILGKKSTLRYLFVLTVFSVMFGLGVDYLYELLNISPRAQLGEAGEVVPYPIKLLSVLVVLFISAGPLYAKIKKVFVKNGPETFTVSGIADLRSSGGAIRFEDRSGRTACECHNHKSPCEKGD